MFTDGNFSEDEMLNYFKANPEEISFITAIEAEMQIDLAKLLK